MFNLQDVQESNRKCSLVFLIIVRRWVVVGLLGHFDLTYEAHLYYFELELKLPIARQSRMLL